MIYSVVQGIFIEVSSKHTHHISSSFHAFNDIATRWLDWQCRMVSGIKVGRVFLFKDATDTRFDTLAFWPETEPSDDANTLHKLASNILSSQDVYSSKVSYPINGELTVCDAIALPLRYGDKIIGAVVFLQNVHSQEHQKAVFPLLQWGCTWLESSLIAAYEEKSQLKPLLIQAIKLIIKDETLELSGHQLCNLIAQKLACQRVALGLVKGLQVPVLALSDQLRFDSRSNYVDELQAVMQEAIDQRENILYPCLHEKKNLITQKHKTLSLNHQDMNVFTLILFNGSQEVGVLVLLRKRAEMFSEEERHILKSTCELLGPVIHLKLKNEHSFITRLQNKLKNKTRSFLEVDHVITKFLVIAPILLLITLSLVQTSYYIYAKSSLEGEVQQVIIAPQEGYIKTSYARAGDIVDAQQLLLRLEDKNLRLELEVLFSEEAKLHREYQKELAHAERAKVSILSAQIEQVQAQIKLAQTKLQQTQFKAPFSGVIVSGDLSQSLGKPVKKGEELFEIARIGKYRVSLDVDEYDVSKLKLNQHGELRLVGLPYETIDITITRIIPVAQAKDGGNFFHVEAVLDDENSSPLQPGMQGIAKIQVGESAVLWVWTHTLIERLRLWFWSIGL